MPASSTNKRATLLTGLATRSEDSQQEAMMHPSTCIRAQMNRALLSSKSLLLAYKDTKAQLKTSNGHPPRTTFSLLALLTPRLNFGICVQLSSSPLCLGSPVIATSMSSRGTVLSRLDTFLLRVMTKVNCAFGTCVCYNNLQERKRQRLTQSRRSIGTQMPSPQSNSSLVKNPFWQSLLQITR